MMERAALHTIASGRTANSNLISTWKFLVVVALGSVALAGFLLYAPASPIVEPDSGGYLDFSSLRTAGYPLFLMLVGAQGALIIQPILAALALVYLGCELLILTRSILAASGTMLAIALNPHLVVMHYKIMSESLYVSLLMVFLGLVMHLARKATPGWMAAASTAAGLMIAVRPAGWFLLPLMVLAALMLRWRSSAKLMLLGAAVVPLLAVTLAEFEFRSAWHGGKLDSLLDITLYGKAGMIEAPATGNDAPAARLLEQDYAPVRKIVRESPDASIRRFLTMNYEVCIEFSCSSSKGISTASPEAHEAALQRIAANPMGFLKLAWVHYSALWIVYGALHPNEAPLANAFIAAHRPMPFEIEIEPFKQRIIPLRAAIVMQPFMRLMGLLTGVLTVAGLTAVIVRHHLIPTLVVALVCALAVQGSFMLVSLTGVGIPRYMLAMWPAMMLMLSCLGISLIAMLRRTRAAAAEKLRSRAQSF